MSSVFLLLLLPMLWMTVWLAARVVGSAHQRALIKTQSRGLATEIFSQSPARVATVLVEKAEPILTDNVVCSLLKDVYADPIDGVPFSKGELIWPCQCGVAYRLESVEWLVDNLGGRCGQCNAVMVCEGLPALQESSAIACE